MTVSEAIELLRSELYNEVIIHGQKFEFDLFDECAKTVLDTHRATK